MDMVLQETKIRLSKAVRLRDAFTGEPVSAGVTLRTLSGGRVEKKREGYFLFLDVGSPVFEMEVESPVYQRQKLEIMADSARIPDTKTCQSAGNVQAHVPGCFLMEKEA